MTHKWLDRVCRLHIKLWRYTKNIDASQRIHIGPMADEWKRIMGIGDGVTIDGVDAVGILLKATQELNDKVSRLEQHVKKLQDQIDESVHAAGTNERDAAASAIADAFARDAATGARAAADA